MSTTVIQVDAISFVMLLILLISSRAGVPYAAQNKYFRRPLISIMALLVLDMMNWCIEGRIFTGAAALLYIVNAAYFIMTEVASFTWYWYAYKELYPDHRPRSIVQICWQIPFWVLFVFAVTAPFNHLLFYIDSTNEYVRGPFFSLQFLVGFAYLAVAAVIALRQRKYEILMERRRECVTLASFIILPLIGGVLQLIIYDANMLWPCAGLSVLLVYIGMNRREISIDALTMLNNRGRFNHYISGLCEMLEGQGLSDTWFMIIDVDEFKKINDTYGHFLGDMALKQVATAIKRAYGDTNAFIARYGGDEFAIILKCEDEQEMRSHLNRLHQELDEINAAKEYPYTLEVSVGCSRYGTPQTQDVKSFISVADEQMYEEKQAHKEIRKTRLRK